MFRAIGMVARWKPVHVGHAAVLHGLCDNATRVLIGVGSANRYNFRNPFTFDETRDMLRLALSGRDNFDIVAVNDLDDGPRWRDMVRAMFGSLDVFVTDNPYVASLMREVYAVAHPIAFVPSEQRRPIDGTSVRMAMARGEAWEHLVPAPVADYIRAHSLDERFRREFGLQTLATLDVVQN